MKSITDSILRTISSKTAFRQAATSGVALLFLVASISILQFECPEDTAVVKSTLTQDAPTYMLHGDEVDSGYLKHVQVVLRRLGYKRTDNSTSFHLLWSHPYPFGEKAPFSKSFLQNLKPYQKVNHYPGTGFYTNKVDLAVTNIKYIPKAFHLPAQKQEIISYAKEHPDKMFVQKSNSHRGIKIYSIKDMDLDRAGTFVQEYVANPLLVDGYKFDIGIYTILTSLDPLRVYIYDGDVLLRFCPKKYEPFDPQDVDKYVVADDYIPTWEVPSLKKAYKELKFNMKDSLSSYLRVKGTDPDKIWRGVEDAIAKVFLAKEDVMSNIATRYNNNNNFFEMVRFDFIVDTELNVYLMEANMSPNLSSAHFPPNRLLYESVLYSLFSLVGVSRRLKSSTLGFRSKEEEEMEMSERHLMVNAEQCLDARCDGCVPSQCKLCNHCLTETSRRILKISYMEHINRVHCKRIFPPRFNPRTKESELNLDQYSPDNRLLVEWFLGKCKQDFTWC